VFIKDFKYFFQKDLGPYKDKKHARSEWVNLWVSKAVYYGWSIVIPLLVLNIPWWQFAIGYVVMHLTAGCAVEATGTIVPSPAKGQR
jgi:linoleoyl-CoA desaturase